MRINRCVSLLLCLSAAFPAISQNLPQKVTVDPWVSLTFPGKVTRLDTLGVILFQTTVDRTTYQLVKQPHTFQQATVEEQLDFIYKSAKAMMGAPKFDGMSKQVSDSMIGGSKGRFIQMAKSDTAKPYHVFSFITVQDTNAYVLTCTSFKPLVKCREDANHFFSHVFFRE